MRSVVVRGLILNLLCVVLSGGLLFLYPRNEGFTITTPSATRFVQGGVLLAGLLMGVSDILIGAFICYGAWRKF